MSGLVWPDAREAVHDLVKATGIVDPFYILPVDHLDVLPVANTWVQRSTEGFVDRVTWVVVDVYAAPGEAMRIA